MWTVDYKPFNTENLAKPGQPGWQTGGAYLTPDGELLTTPQARATYLRTVQDWIIAPQMRTAAAQPTTGPRRRHQPLRKVV